jgi:phosphatidylglycerol---prolipoprotein diacylglyceryl transferase
MTLLGFLVHGHWVHDLPKFVPYLPHTEQIGVRFYGLAYVLGFVGGAWLLSLYAKRGRSLVPSSQVTDLLFAIMLGVFLGGRLGWFLLYHPEMLIHEPLSFFAVWQGGMASHGGFIGVAIAVAIYGRRRRVPFLHLGDLIVTTAPLGLMLGRIANFINGELWGKVSTVSWAVIFPDSAPPGTPLEDIAPRHPSQLYEAFLEGALLLAIFQWRFWSSRAVKDKPGRITGEFLLAYAIVRAIGERFREPDEGIALIFGLSRGTFYSLFLAIAGLILIFTHRRPLALPKPQSGSTTL